MFCFAICSKPRAIESFSQILGTNDTFSKTNDKRTSCVWPVLGPKKMTAHCNKGRMACLTHYRRWLPTTNLTLNEGDITSLSLCECLILM